MKQLSIYKGLLLVLIAIFNLGCERDVYKADITIEQDGEVYSATYDEARAMDESNVKYIDAIIEGIKNSDRSDKYIHNENYVDGAVYNFFVVIPIKSKDSIESKFNGYPLFSYVYAELKTDAARSNSAIGYRNISKDLDGYYHYNVYVHSKTLASYYYLNDIKDVVTYAYWEESDWSTDIEIKTNKLAIKAEEFEHMLDRLAISHERLSFQPDGY